MKQLILALALLMSIACTKREPQALEKTWRVVSIEMDGYDAEILDQVVKAGVFYQFKRDNTYVAKINGENRKGTYKFDEEKMELVTTDDEEGDEEISIITELSEERMVWIKGPNKMVFEPFVGNRSAD